jgi:hypothetical protein
MEDFIVRVNVRGLKASLLMGKLMMMGEHNNGIV